VCFVTLVPVLDGCETSQVLDPFPPEAFDAGPGFDAFQGQRRVCSSDGDCALPEPYCDPADQTCVECLTNDQCEHAICDPLRRNCVEPCSRNSDCTGRAWLCEGTRGVCVECATNSHCDDGEPICHDDNCIECLSEADCDSSEPFCDATRGRCRECMVDEDCSAGAHCTSDGRCENATR
jgi:hypothetical protein